MHNYIITSLILAISVVLIIRDNSNANFFSEFDNKLEEVNQAINVCEHTQNFFELQTDYMNEIQIAISHLKMEKNNLEKVLETERKDFDVLIDNMNEIQILVIQLKIEKNNLEKVLETEREAYDALFALKKKEEDKNWWLSLIGSFFLGALGSYFATVLYEKRKQKVKDDKSKKIMDFRIVESD